MLTINLTRPTKNLVAQNTLLIQFQSCLHPRIFKTLPSGIRTPNPSAISSRRRTETRMDPLCDCAVCLVGEPEIEQRCPFAPLLEEGLFAPESMVSLLNRYSRKNLEFVLREIPVFEQRARFLVSLIDELAQRAEHVVDGPFLGLDGFLATRSRLEAQQKTVKGLTLQARIEGQSLENSLAALQDKLQRSREVLNAKNITIARLQNEDGSEGSAS